MSPLFNWNTRIFSVPISVVRGITCRGVFLFVLKKMSGTELEYHHCIEATGELSPGWPIGIFVTHSVLTFYGD